MCVYKNVNKTKYIKTSLSQYSEEILNTNEDNVSTKDTVYYCRYYLLSKRLYGYLNRTINYLTHIVSTIINYISKKVGTFPHP